MRKKYLNTVPMSKRHKWMKWGGNKITYRCTLCHIIRVSNNTNGYQYYSEGNLLTERPDCKTNPTN